MISRNYPRVCVCMCVCDPIDSPPTMTQIPIEFEIGKKKKICTKQPREKGGEK